MATIDRVDPDGGSVEVLELLVEVLSGSDRGGVGDGFYDRICQAVCRLGGMRRALVFRYDHEAREVRVAGAHGIDVSSISGRLTPKLAPITGQALIADDVIEAAGDLREQFPPQYAGLVGESGRLVCAPMTAAGRATGVILAERRFEDPPFDAAERHLLWTLGKAGALATVARETTANRERARLLQNRIDLAREIHDGVVQRLFAISMALDGDGDLPAEVRQSCAAQAQLALGELRQALQRPLGRDLPKAQTTFAAELARLAHTSPDKGPRLTAGTPDQIPSALEPLALSFLRESVRNARKHSRPSFINVSIERHQDALILEVVNDGVKVSKRAPGMGLRLVAFEALQFGGIVEFGPISDGCWHSRILVPDQSYAEES